MYLDYFLGYSLENSKRSFGLKNLMKHHDRKIMSLFPNSAPSHRFRFIYSKFHIHQNLQLAQMERQARLLDKTYKQNLTILIDTEQTKNEPLFHQ